VTGIKNVKNVFYIYGRDANPGYLCRKACPLTTDLKYFSTLFNPACLVPIWLWSVIIVSCHEQNRSVRTQRLREWKRLDSGGPVTPSV